ncbi:uncharacterized protein E5676_scaffold637G00420 [Cucumis melo var. makuwa]|uniref:Gag-pro-like protein n=1 Tax=Cucumis melo var. makuwa TaxID=1194695 RepID=A0A5D3CWM1_CUCMM|nr:uncharacterized protein E5676_scaffold637G00420 [Cucumis melo var. makuwa]
MSYTKLSPQLLKSHQVAIIPQEPLQPPYPKWYDPNTKCEYHAGAVGHSMENCFPLKTKVQSLVEVGWLKFKKIGEEPDVNQNPSPNHEGPAINVVNAFTKRYNNEGEKFGCANGNQCLFHPKIDDHSIEDCYEFKNEVQKLMDAKILLVGQMNMQDIKVDMIIDASSNKETSNDTSIYDYLL